MGWMMSIASQLFILQWNFCVAHSGDCHTRGFVIWCWVVEKVSLPDRWTVGFMENHLPCLPFPSPTPQALVPDVRL